MPSFDLIVDGRVYHVEIPDPGATPLQVIVDGQSFEIGLSGVASSTYLEPLGRPPRPAPEPAPLPTPPRVPVTRPAEPVGQEYHGEITAPMPGTILSIPVAVGDHVAAGDVLCVLEAMKMRNPIRTANPGIVRAVAVAPGQSVAYGELLLRLEQG